MNGMNYGNRNFHGCMTQIDHIKDARLNSGHAQGRDTKEPPFNPSSKDIQKAIAEYQKGGGQITNL